MINQTQLEFLRDAKAKLGVTWDAMAALTDIDPRALKTYRLPPASPGYRGMSKPVKNAITSALEKHQKKYKKSS